MNVLQVTMRDVVGQRFNGHQLHRRLGPLGHESSMLVIHRQSTDPKIHGHPRWMGTLERGVYAAERVSSLQGLLSPFGAGLPFRGCFRRADVVHWHLVYPHYIGLPMMPWLARLKPTVWTLHDPWATTGHCVHPLDCERWKTGCGRCPDLTRGFAIWFDTTAFNWRVKRALFPRTPFTLVVPSRWLKSRVQASPLLSSHDCHVILPGLDLSLWHARDRAACRARLGIPEEAHVIAFRMPSGNRQRLTKGIPWLLEALRAFTPLRPTYLLAFEERGQLTEFEGKYRIVETGWLNDETSLADALAAADLFVMPSLAETAPTMAMEAMACGTPVIAADGSAMPEMVRAPRAGVVVPARDGAALARAIGDLLGNESLRRTMGEAGRDIVEAEHSLDRHVKDHVELYESLRARARGTQSQPRSG